MKSRHASFALVACLSACTLSPQNGGVDAGFHPPILAKHWQTSTYPLPNGMQVCSISSGYNGITLTLSTPANEQVVAQSNRLMQPGATLTVTAGGQNFETYDTYFPQKTGPELLAALEKGGNAYLDWSEFSGSSSRERVHVQNIVQLEDFNTRVQECRKSLSK